MEEVKKRLKVYCETTFWSYLNGRPTPLAHIALSQAATLQWWQEIAPSCDIYVSQYVNDEALDGDSARAEMRKRSIAAFPFLDIAHPDIKVISNALIAGDMRCRKTKRLMPFTSQLHPFMGWTSF